MSDKNNEIYIETITEVLEETPAQNFSIVTTAKTLQNNIERMNLFVEILRKLKK